MKLVVLSLFISTVAVAIDQPDHGFQLLRGNTKKVSVHGECKDITNMHASRDYFAPTKELNEWNLFKAANPSGLIFSDANCYSSCLQIKTAIPLATSGRYLINPYGGNAAGAVSTYCDMSTDGGGWTMVMKATGADRTAGFNANDAASYWLTPQNLGNPVDLTSTTVFDASIYAGHKVQDIMIRSLSDASKRLTWSHGSNSDSLSWMITNRRRMKGKIIGGGIANLDYRAGCDVGVVAPNAYVGIFASDSGDTGTVAFLNSSVTITPSWLGALVGWGSPFVDYVSGNNMSGGFGSINLVGAQWNLTRHIHGIGNGCNAGEWGGSGNQGTQTMNAHALFIREGTYKRSCREILTAYPGSPDGVYTIDPDGNGAGSFQAYCDMSSDGGGWTRVFAQDITEGYMNATTAYSLNGTNPLAKNYSILDQLENFRNGGTFTFKINWPGYTQRNIWSQTTNPTVDQPVAGYSAITIDSSTNLWGGLERYCAVGCGSSFIDGSINHSNWYYAIGTYAAWGSPGGIPSSAVVRADNSSVEKVELWVR